MLLRIAIADRNLDYAERLCSVLDDNSELRLSSYSDPDALAAAIAEHRFDVLLLDPSMYSGIYRFEKLAVTVMLAGDEAIPYGCAHFPKINKYQRVSELYKRVYSICSDNSDKLKLSSSGGGSASVTVCWSPAGGCGKTAVSVIAASRLAMAGRRTLYISLETYPSDGAFFLYDDSAGLSTLLEHAHESDEKAELYMKGMVRTKSDNLFCIKHFDSPNDIVGMELEDLDWMIKLLSKSGAFDAVVIDAGGIYDKKLHRLFELSDQIILVERPDERCRIKFESFIGSSFDIDDHMYKMKRVLNFYRGKESGLSCDIPVIGRLSAVQGADLAALVAAKVSSAESSFALNAVN